MRLYVVIPALDEARTLRGLLQQILPICPDVIVVDDGSTDGTSETVADLPVTLLRHHRRLGKGAALRDGFRIALARGADGVLTMDADGQHAAADIERLRAAWKRDPQRLVIGARLIGKNHQPAARRRANAVADWFVSWAAGRRIVDSQSGQRIYPRRALELAESCRADGFEFEAEILIELARHRVQWVGVPIEARYAPEMRASHFAPVKDIARITRRLSGHILGGGFLLGNLWRIHGERAPLDEQAEHADLGSASPPDAH
jgi:glycosyltransferase involved in cell wall biosynthesis